MCFGTEFPFRTSVPNIRATVGRHLDGGRPEVLSLLRFRGLPEDIGKTSKTEPSESLESLLLLGFGLWLRFLVTLEVGFGLSMSNSYSTLLRTSVPKETTVFICY